VRIPKTSIRTTWRTDWLAEFSMALVALAVLTRETIFAAVGIGVLLALASLGLIFHLRLRILRRELRVVPRVSRTRVFLGESVEGDLTIRNGSRLAAQVLTIQAIVEKTLSFELSSSSFQLLPPGVTSSSRFAITPLAKGRFQISGFLVTFAEKRRLFTGEVRYGHTDWIEVYPGMRSAVPVSPLALYGGSQDTFRRASAGADYAGIREHAPGDEYHRIEWKATARLRTLMVKEFHPETQTTLQILIDAGRTMHQQSYVGTKFDEALAIAQSLAEWAVASGNCVGIWIYSETEILKVMKPAMGKEQLASFRDLARTPQPQAVSKEQATRLSPPAATWQMRPNLSDIERVSMFVQLLKIKIGLGSRKTGLYKALNEAARTGLMDSSLS